jgi:hypothetical protein
LLAPLPKSEEIVFRRFIDGEDLIEVIRDFRGGIVPSFSVPSILGLSIVAGGTTCGDACSKGFELLEPDVLYVKYEF